MDTKWGARTDGKEVWAIDLKRGIQRKYLRCDDWRVSGAQSLGDEIVISYENGRVRVWDPATDSTHLIL